jgi:hypothetical protein
MEVDGINRDSLHSRVIKEIRKGNPWQPDILLVKGDSGPVVIKDYYGRPFLYRVFVGLFSIWQENRMYQKLAGINGIPKCYGKIDRYALGLEFIQGRTASRLQAGEVKPEFFARLRSIVDDVHARGIVLCDMRNKKNVLVTDTLEPYIIDLCTAFQRGGRWNIPKNFLFGIFYQDDLLGISKLKRKLAPELLSSDEAEKLEKGLFLQRESMAVRDFCVRWLKKLVSKN